MVNEERSPLQQNEHGQNLPNSRDIQHFPAPSQPDLPKDTPHDDNAHVSTQPPGQPKEEQEDEESGSEERDVCAGLIEADTFHGMVPLEDLTKLLKHNGNYLIRSEQVNQDGRKILVSVFWNGLVKDIELRGMPNQGGATFDMINVKPTVLELIEFHRAEKIPIPPDNVYLGSAIKRKSWELKRDNIIKDRKLGEGAFGEVYRGTLKLKTSGRVEKVAIKIPKATDLNNDLVGEAMKEARIQKDYLHPNVVRLYGVSAEIMPLMIVLEYVNGGSLDVYLKKHSANLTPDHKAVLCYDISSGLEYLHSRDCIHRDIAARNCLMCTKYGIVKISDFGLSSVGTIHVMDRTKPAPIRWLAPEVLKTATYLKSSDIWSLAIVYWEIYTNCAEMPYKNYTLVEVQHKLSADQEFHPEMPLITLQQVRKLALKCWSMDHSKRPTAEQCTIELGCFAERQRFANIPDLNFEIAQVNRSSTPGKPKKKKKKRKSTKRKAAVSQVMTANPTSMHIKSFGTTTGVEAQRSQVKLKKQKSLIKSANSKVFPRETMTAHSREPMSSGNSAVSKKRQKSVKSRSAIDLTNLHQKRPTRGNSNKKTEQ